MKCTRLIKTPGRLAYIMLFGEEIPGDVYQYTGQTPNLGTMALDPNNIETHIFTHTVKTVR